MIRKYSFNHSICEYEEFLTLKNETPRMSSKQFIKNNPKIFRFFRKLYYVVFKRHFYGLTAPIRTLPDFIVFAADRAGTSSLFHYLEQHPCICASDHDHLGFFDSNFDLGINFYKSFFPTILLKYYTKFRRKHFMTYDVTASYYRRPWSIQNILKTIPSVKLIAILRNPVDGAYSGFHKDSRLQNITFENAIKDELEFLEREKNDIEKNGYANIMQDSFLAKGFYEKQLKLWLNNFPKHQILFLTTEELTDNHEKTFKKIFTFLKLPDYKIKNYKKQNVGKYKNKMNLTTRNFLIDFYKSHNKKLYELLENNFDWDK